MIEDRGSASHHESGEGRVLEGSSEETKRKGAESAKHRNRTRRPSTALRPSNSLNSLIQIAERGYVDDGRRMKVELVVERSSFEERDLRSSSRRTTSNDQRRKQTAKQTANLRGRKTRLTRSLFTDAGSSRRTEGVRVT